jgi:Protein of unknown function (DUF3040)
MALAGGKDHCVSYAFPDLLHAAHPPRGKPRCRHARMPDGGVGIPSTQASRVRGESQVRRRLRSWRREKPRRGPSSILSSRGPSSTRPDRALDCPVFLMSLSRREQNILENIESQLRGEDPALARQLTVTPRRKYARPGPRMLLLTVLSVVGGIGIMILAAISGSPILMIAAVTFLVVAPTLTAVAYLLRRE